MERFDSVRRDLVHAARSLSKDRVFSIVCIVSLGIGMGAFVALATMARAVSSPARLVDPTGLTEVLVLPNGPLRAKAGVWALDRWSYPDFQVLRETDTGMAITGSAMEFSDIGVPSPEADAPPPRVATLYVSANYFSTLGVPLARGAGFDPAVDDTPSAEARVVLSHDFWRARMSSDPDAIGKTLTIEGVHHTIVGIAPEQFQGHFHFFQSPGTLLFVPLERHPRLRANPDLRVNRTVDWVRIHGKLAPGVNMTRANALVSATVAGLAQRFPATNEFKAATVAPYFSQGAVGRPASRQMTTLLLGLSAAVLGIVCLNISGMMLVRAATRERELSIRAALGADRRRLIQHLFFEAMLLAIIGGGLSAIVLFGIPAAVASYFGVVIPLELDFDATGAAISIGLCLVVSVLFGLLPAIRFSRPNLSPALKDDTGGGRRQTIRVHRVAAMVQVGIAIPFLVVSGVMLDRVRTADFGFPLDGIAAARLPLQTGAEQDRGFTLRTVLDTLQQSSGVQSVAVAGGMPIDFDSRIYRVGNPVDARFASAHLTHVGENFLETVEVPIRRGRTITRDDRMTAASVAVLSEPLARLLFEDRDPLGAQVTVALDEELEEVFTVIGVTADFATSQLTTDRPQILLPWPETSAAALADADVPVPSTYVIARGAPGTEPALRSALENVLREAGVEPLGGEVFPGVVTGQDLVQKSIGDLIAESIAMGVVGGAVLVLAALGIVGVVGFMVAMRTREIAVRMALGSTRMRVFRMMVSDIVRLAVPGVIGGLLLAAILIRSLENVMGTPLTLGPTPLGVMEPVIYAGASALAVTVALLAGLPAARRATSVQPMVAMRTE